MVNKSFLKAITHSFNTYLETGSRSNKKLKILHGAIAENLITMLGAEYKVKSLGVGDGKESRISGRYIDKAVDITILKKNKAIAGIAVKFVMQNYSQNSNNYFENMLGETANIKCNKIPYFQIFIIPEKLPYYNKDGKITKWESFSEHNASKYCKLSEDDAEHSLHTPTKTLLYVIKLPEPTREINNRVEYNEYYRSVKIKTTLSKKTFGKFKSSVIVNDYEEFLNKTFHYIKYI